MKIISKIFIIVLLLSISCKVNYYNEREKQLKETGWKEISIKSFKENINDSKPLNTSDLEKKLSKKPNDVMLLTILAKTYLYKDTKKATEYINRAYNIDTNEISGLLKMAKVYTYIHKKNRTEKILNKIDAILKEEKETDSDKASDYYLVAFYYKDLKNYQKALELINEALKLQPDDIELMKDKKYLILKGLHDDYERVRAEILEEMEKK